jgi:DNA-directed RNA polymerase subunit H (RpoH/RPB5)
MNEKTITEMIERLQQEDEMTILELLDITSEELPQLLMDQVEERYDVLLEYFEDDTEED